MGKIPFEPFGDRLLLKPEKPETKRKSGVIIPDDAQERPQEAVVLAVGSGKMMDDGKRVSVEAKVGDVVVYSRPGAFIIKQDDEEFLIVSERDILCRKKGGK